MELAVWSAGKNGIYAKIYLIIGLLLITIWASVALLLITLYINGLNDRYYIQYIILCVIAILTIIEPLAGANIIKISFRAYRRNKVITIKLYNRDEYRADRTGNYFVVYADSDGLATCNDIAAFEDWAYFNGRKSFKKYVKMVKEVK